MSVENANSPDKIESEPDEPDSWAGSAWNLCTKFAAKVFRWLQRSVKVVAGYYWERRNAFWRHFTEYARDLRPERFVTREIRVSTEEEYLNADYDQGSWKIRLPKMCIVCGEPQQGKPLNGEYQVENLTGPFWSVILGVFMGLMLWLFGWGWFSLISLVVGFLVGYRRHSTVDVAVRYWKCDKHQNNRRYPRLRTFADFLIIGVGSKAVRQEFRLQRKADRGDYGSYEQVESHYEPDEYVPPEADPHRVPDIDPIPLAEEAHESVDQEEKDYLDPLKPGDAESHPL